MGVPADAGPGLRRPAHLRRGLLTAAELGGRPAGQPGRGVRRGPLPGPGRPGHAGQRAGHPPAGLQRARGRLAAHDRGAATRRWPAGPASCARAPTLLGPDRPAGARVAETAGTSTSWSASCPACMARWEQYKARQDNGPAGEMTGGQARGTPAVAGAEFMHCRSALVRLIGNIGG